MRGRCSGQKEHHMQRPWGKTRRSTWEEQPGGLVSGTEWARGERAGEGREGTEQVVLGLGDLII